MSALSEKVHQYTHYTDTACQTGVHALSQLVQARHALFEADQAGVDDPQRKVLLDRFAHQQAVTREAMKPLVGLSPETVGEDYFAEKWEKPLQALGQTFKNAFGRSLDQKNEVSGFHLQRMLSPDYRPHPGDIMLDPAFRTLPVYAPALDARSRPQTNFNFEGFAQDEAIRLRAAPADHPFRSRMQHG